MAPTASSSSNFCNKSEWLMSTGQGIIGEGGFWCFLKSYKTSNWSDWNIMKWETPTQSDEKWYQNLKPKWWKFNLRTCKRKWLKTISELASKVTKTIPELGAKVIENNHLMLKWWKQSQNLHPKWWKTIWETSSWISEELEYGSKFGSCCVQFLWFANLLSATLAARLWT